MTSIKNVLPEGNSLICIHCQTKIAELKQALIEDAISEIVDECLDLDYYEPTKHNIAGVKELENALCNALMEAANQNDAGCDEQY